ncbi:hypothetical protein HMPREF1145_0366 [Oribacterium parvum ACB8]|nr:hypothetical protein HMPREF1145_0366 [Oribacterium parvum ACB8]
MLCKYKVCRLSLLFKLKYLVIFTFLQKISVKSKDSERKFRTPSFLVLFLSSFVPLLAS